MPPDYSYTRSLLPITQDLAEQKTWDKDKILERGTMLFDRALPSGRVRKPTLAAVE